jgi:PKD repeat protein
MRNNTIFIVIIFACLINVWMIIPVQGLPLKGNYTSPMGEITISAVLPDSPPNITAYRVTPSSKDMAYFSVEELEKIRTNVPSDVDAPQVAQQILDSYGGLPQDAILIYNTTEYLEKINVSSGEVEEKYPISTNVQYSRSLNEGPVVGEGAFINIELGDNGELLYLNKEWKSVSPNGVLPVISLTDAIQKLKRGEVLNPKRDAYNVSIIKIRLGYYEKGRNQSQEYLDPAWLFRGTIESGDPIQYYVYARRFANFTAIPTEVTMYQPVQFTDTSETNPTKWYWEFGDGKNSTEQNPSHLYQTGGNYTVNLTVWNDMGSDTISRGDYVHVYYSSQAPVAGFELTPIPNKNGSPITVIFNDTSTGDIINWSWDFEDGTFSYEQNPVHTFTYDESYPWAYWHYISLTVIDSVGRVSIYDDAFKMVKDHTVNFTGNPTSGRSPLSVNFTDTSDDAYPLEYIDSFIWNFGDGTQYQWNNWEGGGTTAPTNISHVYTSPGNYTVTLIHSVLDIWDYSENKENYITVYDYLALPVVEFSANVTSGRSPLAVAFADATTGSPTNWNWSFGDGTNSTEQNPVHVYTTAGTYTVSLTAANAYGENITTKVDYISVYEPIPTVADFTANVTSGYEPLAVAFSDTSANAPEQWNWSFGDGTTSTEKNPVHVYHASGKYSVSLQVTNEYGTDTKVRTDYITVLGAFPTQTIAVPPATAPVADFTGTPVSGKEPLMVLFNDTSANFPSSWLWDFGDGTTSAEQHPVHDYSLAGNYTVSLQATNDEGSDTKTRPDYITVTPLVLPVADFTANTTSGLVPLAVSFIDTSSGSPTSWLWTFGDGTMATDQNPVHVYATAGTYTVSLEVSNPDGSNTMTKTDYITVLPTTGTVQAGIRIEPETLNLKSKGTFTAFITLPMGYDMDNIDVASLVCEGAHAKSGHATGDGSDMYIAKFNRQDMVNVNPGDSVLFTVIGNLNTGTGIVEFAGNDTIRVID